MFNTTRRDAGPVRTRSGWAATGRPSGTPSLLSTAALALLTWLSACGPGVGGTGTGETNGLAHFGATAASVCAADVGSVLGCALVPGAAGPTPVASATPVWLADAASDARAQARALDSTIELNVACTGLRFRGQWGELAGQGPRFYGQTGPDGALQPATLLVQLGGASGASGAGGAAVVVTLRDAAGAVLLGPTALVLVPAAVTHVACG